MRGMGLIVYGVEGIGKTGFALQFPKPLRCFSVNETGYEDLYDIGEVPDGCENEYTENWDDLLTQLHQSRDVRTVVIDSLSGVNQYWEHEIIENEFTHDDRGNALNEQQAKMKFTSFSNGWRLYAPAYAEKLEVQCSILRQKGINVILIGHHKLGTSKSAIGEDVKALELNMESWPKAVLTKWAQAVLLMQMDFDVKVTKQWRGKTTEAKANTALEEKTDRIIYTEKHPSHDAKNRLKVPPFIMMGDTAKEAYDNFVNVLQPNFQAFLKETN